MMWASRLPCRWRMSRSLRATAQEAPVALRTPPLCFWLNGALPGAEIGGPQGPRVAAVSASTYIFWLRSRFG